MDQKYFKPLTGLRFIAALMVFVSHLLPRIYSPFVNNILVEFQIGVPIFFVLSGFLIAYRYYDPVAGIKDGLSNYFVNRFIRIVPIYLVITIVNCFWYHLNWRTAFLNLTLLHGYFSDYVFNPLPHTWSLTVECTFYLLVPFIFWLMRKGIEVLSQYLIFLISGFLLTNILGIFPSNYFWGDDSFMLVLTFFGRSFEFLVGIRLALFVKSSQMNFTFAPWKTYAGIATFFGMIVILSLVGGLHSYWGILLHNVILPLCIAFVIYGLIAGRNLISTILSTPLFQLLGNISFVFFLIHYGFWQKFMIHYLFVDFMLGLVATIILSIILYKVIEEPLIKITKIQLSKIRNSKRYKQFKIQVKNI